MHRNRKELPDCDSLEIKFESNFSLLNLSRLRNDSIYGIKICLFE